MRRLPALVLLVLVAAVVATPGAASARDGHDDCMVDVNKTSAQPSHALPTSEAYDRSDSVTVYLNRHATTLNAGWDSSTRNASQLVYSRGRRSITTPGFTGSQSSWNRIVSCVQDGLSTFNVDVVDTRPRSGDYVMAMIGGRSSMLGYRGSISGVAPYSGKVLANAVLFVFARSAGNRVASVCQTALHEIGHTLGLDHTYYGPDTMSYLRTRSKKTFRDRDMACGEFSRRRCGTGQSTQNSYQRLVSAVGLRADDTHEDPAEEPPIAAPPADQPPEDNIPTRRPQPPSPPSVTPSMPSVHIVSPRVGERVYGGKYVHIILRAEAASGVARVELAWAQGKTTHVLTCGAIPRNLPATCLRDGDFYAFTLNVGVGQRTFAVRVTDAAGNQTLTQPRTLSLTPAAAPPAPPRDWADDDDGDWADDDD